MRSVGRLLLLSGQWMYDPHVVPDDDDDRDIDTTWFQAFRLVRAPRTGIVFQVRQQDDRLLHTRPDNQATEALRTLPPLPESALIEGEVDDLRTAFSRLLGA